MKEFEFTGCFEIKELLGLKADDELKLMELIEEVPIDSIYYHMHSYFLRHYYITEPFPNDFANWAAIQVRDKVLGEKLSIATPWQINNLEEIRSQLIEIIDNHLSDIKVIPDVTFGKPFYFMKSEIIEVPTGIRVTNLEEFHQTIKTVDASAIYNHIFEARLKEKRGRSDFAIWLEEVLGQKELAQQIEDIDSYMFSLEGIRGKIIGLLEREKFHADR